MTNLELLKIISKQWADNSDIKELANCKDNKAIEIRRAIESKILEAGKTLPPMASKVPMTEVLSYLGINENRIIKFAKAEQDLKEIN